MSHCRGTGYAHILQTPADKGAAMQQPEDLRHSTICDCWTYHRLIVTKAKLGSNFVFRLWKVYGHNWPSLQVC